MPEQLLSSKTAAQKQAELASLSKATGSSYGAAPASNLKAAPLEQNQTFKEGTNIAGSTVKLADGSSYTMKGATSGGQPVGTSPAQAPEPVGATPTGETGPAPTPTSTTGPTGPINESGATPGLDEKALLASGVTREQIDRMKLILNPQMGANQSLQSDIEANKEATLASLDEEQQMVEEMAAKQKEQKGQLAQQQEELVNDSATVQKQAMLNAQQKEQFDNAQAQKKYDLTQAKNLRQQQQQQADLEQRLARSLSASMGTAFSFNGMMRAAELQQNGNSIVSDLMSETAWGDAEFSFRAMDIDRTYTDKINNIEIDRRDNNLEILSTLSNDLQAIDEKVLSSAQEKKAEGREAVNKYFEQKENADQKAADLISNANETLFEQADKLKEEKRQAETVDVSMSNSLGYFANKFGQAINKDANGNPTPFVGDINEALSAQQGFLVDSRGNKILGGNGQAIPYTPMDTELYNDALKAYQNGTATVYQQALLNSKMGSNNYIQTKYKNGQYGGQCGTFVRTAFTNEGGWEGACSTAGMGGYRSAGECSKGEKRKMINERGFRVGAGTPSVGDVVVFDGANYGQYGHYAIISQIDPLKGKMTLTESNLDSAGHIRTDRQIDLNANGIYGFFTPDLKKEVDDQQPTFVAPGSAGSEGNLGGIGGQGGDITQRLQKLGINTNPNNYTMEDASKASVDDVKTSGFAAVLLDEEMRMQAYEDAGIKTSDFNTLVAQTKAGESWLAKQFGVDVDITNLINDIQDPTERLLARARLNWVKAKLRRESGAAISAQEYINEGAGYFPTSGSEEIEDSSARRGRQIIENGFITGSRKAAPLIGQTLGTYDYSQDVRTGGVPTTSKSLGKNLEASGAQAATGLKGMFDSLGDIWNGKGNEKNYYDFSSPEDKASIDIMYDAYPDATEQDIREAMAILNSQK